VECCSLVPIKRDERSEEGHTQSKHTPAARRNTSQQRAPARTPCLVVVVVVVPPPPLVIIGLHGEGNRVVPKELR
jgi:hypothetical protein